MELAVFSESHNGTQNAAIRCLSNSFLEVYNDGQIFILGFAMVFPTCTTATENMTPIF